MKPMAELSPRAQARIAGALYLIVIAGGIFAEMGVRGRLIVHGDAAATAQNILAHQLLYRLGFAVEVFYLACNVPLTLIFYNLFRVVSRSLALLVVFFSLVGTAVEAASLLFHYAPLVLLGGGSAMSGVPATELQALSYASLRMFDIGFGITLVFFAGYCLALGIMIVRSGLIPKLIGALLVIEGGAYFLNSFTTFLAPQWAGRVFTFLEVTGLAEVFLCLSLLFLGVNEARWRALAHQHDPPPPIQPLGPIRSMVARLLRLRH
jgi:hypothetical protein